MRILLYAGKGGVGKTSIAAATGIVTAEQGVRTLVMSLDPAHSLSDAFDLDRSLMDKNRGAPIAVGRSLWIQELDVYEEISRSWGEVYRYLSILLNTSGLEAILAEELAVLPGMEEISALLYVNQYAQEGRYDLIILDCAPTAESIRFVSIPRTLDWYMKKVFRLERRLMRYVRPMARTFSDIPLPEDDYFAAIEALFARLRGVDRLLCDPAVTSVRLVTSPEKMVLRETQRAFMFFSLHQLSIDGVFINRIFPPAAEDGFVKAWADFQKGYVDLAESCFAPIPILRAPFYESEVIGHARLATLGRALYGVRNPTDIFYVHRAVHFAREGGRHCVKLHLPFATKGDIDLAKVGEELVVRMGNFKKSIVLPRAFVPLEPERARLLDPYLIIEFGGNHAGEGNGKSVQRVGSA
jgi:arsenite-transporting ATPase